MGQHKTNKTAILAAEGKIPPKPRPMSKAELEARMKSLVLMGMARALSNRKEYTK